MRGAAWLLIAATLSGAAVALAQGAAAGDAVIVDPEGDAYETTPESASRRRDSACVLLKVREQCDAAPRPSMEALQVGTPAPPAMDIVAVRFADTPTTLEVAFEVASLGERYDGTFFEGDQGPVYNACWDIEAGDCREGAQVAVQRAPDGGIELQPDVSQYRECNVFFWCNWRVDARLEPGTPGRIVVEVPRAMLLEPDAPALTGLFAASGYYDWRGSETFLTYHMEAAGQERSGVLTGSYVPTDYAGSGETYALRTTRAPGSVASTAWTASEPGMGGAYLDRADLLGVTFSDNATTLTVDLQIARVEEINDPPLWFDVYIGAPDGTFALPAVELRGDAATTYSYACAPGEDGCRDIQVDVELRPGAPGSIVLHIARADLGRPRAGEFLNLFAADAADIKGQRLVDGGETAPVLLFTSARNGADWFGYARPWAFTVDTAPGGGPVTLLRDAVGDTALPLGVLDEPAAYDVTYVKAEGTAPGMTRITMGLADLSRVVVPQGFSGVLYASAVETAAGAFMAGYYKSGANDDGGEFFCTPDVDVFTQTARDPTEVVWQPITGLVTLARSGAAAQGGGSSGSIAFHVPSSCLAAGDAETVAGQRLGAGTYLINAATGAVSEVDSIRGDEPLVLGAAAPAPARGPWWAAPFWGLAALAAVGGGGVLALLARHRRRTALARELRAIDDAHAKHRADAPAWKRAMTERRTLAADLLRRGKLRPDEVLVIERRVELLSADVVATPHPAAALAPGALLLERYEVRRMLGEGSQGRAFLARDLTLQRDVVVKSVRTMGLDGNARRAILAEARLAGGIGHPNVVRVHDVREEGGEALLILEYVEGGSLRDLLARRGRLPAAEAVAVARGVLAGLSAAHERGIVHRDVKPENVLLAKDGTPRLADFGAAREVRSDATFVPQAAGTLAYMSPEQVRGAHVDARSDLYSVGAILAEMLTGAPYLPLGQVDQFQARAMIIERAPALSLPEGALLLTGVLLRALAKQPHERYQTADEMLAALDAATA